MSRFRELVSEAARDELEETQDIEPMPAGVQEWCSYACGVWRCPADSLSWRPAPELSERFPTIHTRLSAKQAD